MSRRDQLASLAGGVISLPARIIEPVMTGLQKLLGIKRMPWVFLFPNMLAVILFSLLPVFINIHYSFTGSDRLYPQDRPFVGGGQLRDPVRLRQLSRSGDLFARPVLAGARQ